MNEKQKREIIKTIEADATAVGYYMGTDRSDCCVIGGLALAAKVKVKAIRAAGDEFMGCEIYLNRKAINNVAWPVMRRFGLTRRQLTSLQVTNDTTHELKQRREALIEMVNSWRVS